MKKIILIFTFFITLTTFAQEDKTVSLTVTGTGKTLEEAKTNALRSAIEQAFGAFISSKTEILNDNLVKDEIVSVANGNIQSFDILDKTQLLDNNWSTTIKAVVSVNKLISFVESKGITVEIKGGLFALNIEQQRLNEENEVKSIYNLSFILQSYMQNSFDYELNVEDPISIDGSNDNFKLPLTVFIKANKNIEALNENCLNTLQNISLKEEELINYNKLNKPTFSIIFKSNVEEKKIFFRKKISTELLSFIFSLQKDYINNFVIDLGITKLSGESMSYYSTNESSKFIKLFSINELVSSIYFNHNTSLNEIKEISSSTVLPNKNKQFFKLPFLKLKFSDLNIEQIISDYVNYYSKEQGSEDFDIDASFPGKLYNYIGKNFQVPEESPKGKVVASFVVEKDGSLSNIRIIIDVGYGSGKEMVRVLRSGPKWIPAEKNGKKVTVTKTISINVTSAE
jgi:hypothetical protein